MRGYRGGNVAGLRLRPLLRPVPEAPAVGFFCACRWRCIRATCLQIAYKPRIEKGFTTIFIAMNPYLYWCRRDESNTRPSHYEFSPADKAKKYWKHSERKLLSLLKFPHSAVAVDATQPPAQRSMSVPELCHADRHAVPARSRGPPVPATNRDTA